MRNIKTLAYYVSNILVIATLTLALLAYTGAITLGSLPLTQILLTTTMLAAIGAITSSITNPTSQTAQAGRVNDTLFNAVDEALIIFNDLGRVIYINPAASAIIGKDVETAIGLTYKEALPLFNEEGNSIYIGGGKDPFYTAYQTNKSQTLKNVQLFFNESSVHLNVTLNPYIDDSSAVPFIFVLMHDVSEEQALEKMKLDFVAMAAHELRTPMTSIRGYLEILTNEASNYLKEEHKMFLDHASLASERLVGLMNNLLSISQIERHKVQLNLEVVDLSEIIEKTVRGFKPDADEKGLELRYDKPKTKLPKAHADPKYIQQIIDNLVHNAISYTHAGSVVVSIKPEGSHTLVVSVKDTGEGIPTEALPHMFEKFYRVSSLLEQGSKGTGLGLYIAKKLIELHNGKIWVESVEGKGTEFSFSLPTVSKEKKKR